MQSTTLEKVCLTIIRWGSYLILFLPLLVYRGTLYPYIFSKIISFRILVEIIFTAWLFLAIYNKKYRLHPVKSREAGISPKAKLFNRAGWRHPLILTLTIFVCVLILTAIVGVDVGRSFWSTQERMTGVLTILHFWLWFLVLTSTFSAKGGSTSGGKEWRDWQKLIWASLICSFLVGLYGLGQKMGLKFLLKEEGGAQMTATLGNSIFLGAYSLLHIFLAGFLVFWEKKRIWQFIAIIFFIFNLIIMFLAASRGVTIACGLAMFLFLILVVFILSSKQTKKIIIPIFILLIIVTAAGFIFFQTPQAKFIYPKLPRVIVRVIYLPNLVSGSEQRLLPWQMAWQGFKARPILGWGWENYNIVFNKYYRPEILRRGEEGTWFDRSHNQIMDLLVLAGGIGTVAYLCIWLSLFWLLIKKIKKETNYRLRLSWGVIATMFLAYFVQNLFVFDTPAPLIVFYFSLGLCYFVTQRDTNLRMHTNDTNIKNRASNIKDQGSKIPLPILILLILVFLPLAIYKFNIEPFQQSRLALDALSVAKTDVRAGLSLYQKSLAKSVFTNPEVRLQLIKTIVEQKREEPTYKEGLDFAISEMKKNTQEHSLDARYWLYLGQLYNLKGGEDKEYLVKAEEALNKSRNLSPKRQQIYFESAKTKILQGNYEEGIKILEEALSLDDQAGESYWQLAMAHYFNRDYKAALVYIDKAFYYNLYLIGQIERMIMAGNVYALNENYERATAYYRWARETDPSNIEAYIKLATTYYKSGNRDEAIKILRQITEINPAYQEQVEKFIIEELK